MSVRWVRRAAAAVVLAAACLLCLRLGTVYWGAWRFRQYLVQLAHEPQILELPDDWIRAQVVNRAAALGLPVRSDQVRVQRTGAGLELEVRYVAPVHFALYSVDLHFRPHVSRR
jgi:hypothetical protein